MGYMTEKSILYYRLRKDSFIFSIMFRMILGPIHLLIKWVAGTVPAGGGGGVKRQGH
jgi:hypothetical protein